MTINTIFTRAEMKIRLLRQTVIPEDETQCWLWTGKSFDPHGSPNMAVKRRGGAWGKDPSARLMYWVTYGDFDPDLIVIRDPCINPICVNPAHMKLIEKKEQNVNSGKRLLMSHGEEHHNAVLNDDLVRKLRSGELSIKDVMAMTGMTPSAVRKAKLGIAWKHVT